MLIWNVSGIRGNKLSKLLMECDLVLFLVLTSTLRQYSLSDCFQSSLASSAVTICAEMQSSMNRNRSDFCCMKFASIFRIAFFSFSNIRLFAVSLKDVQWCKQYWVSTELYVFGLYTHWLGCERISVNGTGVYLLLLSGLAPKYDAPCCSWSWSVMGTVYLSSPALSAPLSTPPIYKVGQYLQYTQNEAIENEAYDTYWIMHQNPLSSFFIHNKHSNFFTS